MQSQTTNSDTDAKPDKNDDALSDSYFPIFKSPYNQFYQWSKNLVELDLSWRIKLPKMKWSNPAWTRIRSLSDNPTEIIQSSLDTVFDYLNNLTSLSMTRYPFAYFTDKIGHLSNLVSFNCYGSQMICMPRTMYKLKQLTKFTPYTSYNLHYLPYEICECPLNDTTISTGALYNNFKNKMLFPPLPLFPTTFVSEINAFVFNKKQLKEYILNSNCILNIGNLNELILEYAIGESTFCSVCKMDILVMYLHYIWVFVTVGTDNVGLLGRFCPLCIEKRKVNMKKHDFVSIGMYKKPDKKSWYGGYRDDDSLYENLEILQNAKNYIDSVRVMSKYKKLGIIEFGIREITGGKYFGGKYNKFNVLQSWDYFWKYNLQIEFDHYELYRNIETNEVNVKLFS